MPHYVCPKTKTGKPGPAGPAVRDPNAPDTPRECGVLDLGCAAGQAINGWFRGLVKSGLTPTLDLLRHSVLATPDLDDPVMARPLALWSTSRVIADTCFVLLVTLAGVGVMCGQVTSTDYSVKDVVFRVVFGFITANESRALLTYAIRFANGVSGAVLMADGKKISAQQAADILSVGVQASIGSAGIFVVLVLLVVLVLAVGVLLTYMMRLALTMLLIAAAPIALMFHALPQTEGIAILWWRSVTSLLAIQICQSLVLVTAATVFFSQGRKPTAGADTYSMFAGLPTTRSGLLNALLLIALLYILIRIPSWVARTIWHPPSSGIAGRLIRSFVMYKTFGLLKRRPSPRTARSGGAPNRAGGGKGGGRSGGSGRSGSGRSGSGRPGGGGPGGGSGGSGPGGGGPGRGSPGGGPSPTGPGGGGPSPTGGTGTGGSPVPHRGTGHGRTTGKGGSAGGAGPNTGSPGRPGPGGGSGAGTTGGGGSSGASRAGTPASGGSAGPTRYRQLRLNVAVPARAAAPARPAQLALFPAPRRIAHPPAPAPVSARAARSRQLMLPGMPKRPVPPRQLALRLDPPPGAGKNRSRDSKGDRR